jgi:hypothetical protein
MRWEKAMSASSPSEPPPPASRARRKSATNPLDALSRDGIAAVLHYVRAALEDERRRTPSLRDVSRRIFVGRVKLAANDATEGVFRERRMFIGPLFRFLYDRGETAGMPLAAFKARLLGAYKENWVCLTTCRRPAKWNAMMVVASAVRCGRRTFHFIDRSPPDSLHRTLDGVLRALSCEAGARVVAFARRVLDDERRRHGRPRLLGLSPEAFAARMQAVANEGSGDLPILELFRRLDDRGEVTGLSLETFKARLLAAHRAGRLALGAGSGVYGYGGAALADSSILNEETTFTVVRRTGELAPIPWGPPPPLIVMRRSLWGER